MVTISVRDARECGSTRGGQRIRLETHAVMEFRRSKILSMRCASLKKGGKGRKGEEMTLSK